MTANTRLSVFALVVLVASVLAAALAVALNWPSQFGGVGTDAGQDLLSRGTAISAPLAPAVGFILTAFLVRFRGGVGWFGIGLAWVLVAAGVTWCVIAVAFVVLGLAAARERLTNRDAT